MEPPHGNRQSLEDLFGKGMIVTEFADRPHLYPRTIQLSDLDVTFSRMDAADRIRVHAFTQGLPEKDLLFLRHDITDSQVIEDWLLAIERGNTVTLLAEESGKLIGYCSLHRSPILWTRHLGEIRMLVSPNYRGKGIGKSFVEQLFGFTHTFGLQKVMVNMMSTQRDAQTLFHNLGFIPEALLHDWAIDRNGRTHDLIVMSREVDDGEMTDGDEADETTGQGHAAMESMDAGSVQETAPS